MRRQRGKPRPRSCQVRKPPSHSDPPFNHHGDKRPWSQATDEASHLAEGPGSQRLRAPGKRHRGGGCGPCPRGAVQAETEASVQSDLRGLQVEKLRPGVRRRRLRPLGHSGAELSRSQPRPGFPSARGDGGRTQVTWATGRTGDSAEGRAGASALKEGRGQRSRGAGRAPQNHLQPWAHGNAEAGPGELMSGRELLPADPGAQGGRWARAWERLCVGTLRSPSSCAASLSPAPLTRFPGCRSPDSDQQRRPRSHRGPGGSQEGLQGLCGGQDPAGEGSQEGPAALNLETGLHPESSPDPRSPKPHSRGEAAEDSRQALGI